MKTFREDDVNRDTAGRFDEKPQTEAEANLPQGSEKEPTRLHADRETAAFLLDFVNRRAVRAANGVGVPQHDRDDIVQDTIITVLQAQNRGKTHATAPAFLNTSTNAVAQRYIGQDKHHYDLTAERIVKETVGLKEQELGRHLSEREVDLLAAEIRENRFKPGNRPKEGFWENRHKPLSLDVPVSDDSHTTLGDLIAANEDENVYGGAASAAADALDQLTLEDKTPTELKQKKAELRQSAWVLVAGADGPAHRVNAIPAARPVLNHIAELGGAAAAAKAWEDGDLADADADVLFSPFDVDGNRERQQVCAILLRHRDYADRLYGAAVTAAVDPKATANARRKRGNAAASARRSHASP